MSAADLTLEDLDARHHEVLAGLRVRGPVVWVDAVGGWVVTGRDVAIEVMRDPVRFTVDDPRFSTAQVVGPSMLSLDGAEHDRHRAPFAAAFRPSDVTRRYAEVVTEMARRLVAELAPRGEAELRRELAGPLAVAVVARSLGLERIDPVQLLAWYDAIVAGVAEIALGRPAADDARRAFGLLGEALGAAAHRPDSVLLEAASSLSHTEVVSNAAVFLFGGIETSEGMTANLLHHVLARPEVTARLRADRSLIEAAVEESLRLEPAAARVDRFATCDVEIAGAAIRRGDVVVISLAAAGRDPTVYESPDEFRIDRPNGRGHLAFAQGPHACLGAHLARLESRTALDAVLDLFPDVELVGAPVTTGVVFRKPESVHARWSASPA